MRYSSLLALCAFMLCLNVPEVRGEILTVHTDDIMTHTALLPKPVASDNTFSLAATWWLPDWQGSQGARGSNDIGGGDIVKDDSDCMKHYNLYATCPSPKLSTGVVHPVAGMTCQKSCYCPSEYKYTSSNCSGKYTVSGGSCDGKYNDCVCKSEFKYNSSNCSGEYEVSGTSCGGNYNGCTIRPECTVSSMSCTYGCAGYNSCDRCTSCKSNPDCDVSDKSCTYGCASYNSCSKCTSCKSNPDCSATAVFCDYGCASTNSCGICISCAGNPDCNVSDKSCDCGCASTNSCGKCTSCKSCPPSDPCAGVSCGANAYCSGGSCYCNSGYTGNANSGCTKVETCVSGGSNSCYGQTSSCSSSQIQTSSCKDCSGTMHYSCRAKTCAEQGKKDCNGSCISTSECCGGCPSGQKCENGSCITSCSLPVCKDKVTSKPANSYYTTSSCTDCSGSHTINSGWRCNIGYTQSGNSCISASHCQPPMHDLTCNGRVYCCPAGVYDCKEATGGTGPGGMIMPSKCWTDATTPFG